MKLLLSLSTAAALWGVCLGACPSAQELATGVVGAAMHSERCASDLLRPFQQVAEACKDKKLVDFFTCMVKQGQAFGPGIEKAWTSCNKDWCSAPSFSTMIHDLTTCDKSVKDFSTDLINSFCNEYSEYKSQCESATNALSAACSVPGVSSSCNNKVSDVLNQLSVTCTSASDELEERTSIVFEPAGKLHSSLRADSFTCPFEQGGDLDKYFKELVPAFSSCGTAIYDAIRGSKSENADLKSCVTAVCNKDLISSVESCPNDMSLRQAVDVVLDKYCEMCEGLIDPVCGKIPKVCESASVSAVAVVADIACRFVEPLIH